MTEKILLKEMFKLQDQFNEYTTTDWRNANLRWDRAIWLEAAEAVESLPWKWWKYQEPDMANLRVELVDIWHFAMSYIMVESPATLQEIDNNIDLFLFEKNTESIEMDFLIEKVEFIAKTVLDGEFTTDDLIQALMSTWAYIGGDFDELYKEYIVKNSLNKFRQDNGYKDNTYRKIWILDGADVEDNVVAWKIAETLECDENLFNTLQVKLAESYTV
jgi:hypothetical protein